MKYVLSENFTAFGVVKKFDCGMRIADFGFIESLRSVIFIKEAEYLNSEIQNPKSQIFVIGELT
ncbi:hypothetical protein D1AOALGA4SA_6035 [Olavius algarvensis Delta 1 endosymbiont]|nr:hypothetical protein D1AOALGA4SA_6035 [Olavius algarvensis Delta 1 endosymbiont]